MATISSGFKRSFRFRKVSTYIMLIQFGLSMLVGLMTINYVNTSIGGSTNFMKIIEGYNHDVFQDLLRFESTGWSMIKTLISLTVGIYLLIGPFISGGLFNAFHKELDQWNVFWTGGSRFYFPFLKLNLLVFGILALIAAFLSFIGFFFTSYSLENFVTEIPALVAIGIIILLLLLVTIYLVSISAKAKWNLIQAEDTGVWKNFNQARKNLKKMKGFYILLGLVFFIISLLFAFLANTLINCIPESSFLLMLLAFLIQLGVLFFRVFLRNAYQAALIT